MDLYREGVFKEKRFGYHTSKEKIQDWSKWWGFVRGNEWGVARVMNP